MIKNSRGFTLVETLLVIGLTGILVLAIYTMQVRLVRSQSDVSGMMDATDLRYEVSGQVAQQDRCSNLLAGKTSAENTELDLGANLKAGASYGKMQITAVQLVSIQNLGNGKRAATIRITGTQNKSTQGAVGFTENIPVYYTVNDAQQIVNCRDNSSVCIAMGGTWRVDHCSFCSSLGGAVQSDNKCHATP